MMIQDTDQFKNYLSLKHTRKGSSHVVGAREKRNEDPLSRIVGESSSEQGNEKR